MSALRLGLLWAVPLVAAACLKPLGSSEGYACQSDLDCPGARCGAAGLCTLEGTSDGGPIDGGADGGADGGDAGVRGPLRLAAYGVGFPYSFNTKPPKFTPSAGFYSSDDAGTIEHHLDALEYGGLHGAFLGWYGPTTDSDRVVRLVMDQAIGRPLVFAPHFLEGGTISTPAQVKDALISVATQLGRKANALRVDGGPVMFIDIGSQDLCVASARWVAARLDAGVQVALWVEAPLGSSPGGCPTQPEGWYPSSQTQPLLATPGAAVLMPGYFDWNDTSPKLARDPARFRGDVGRWLDAGVTYQLLSSFNGWVDGTSVESAVEWASDSGYGVYLDELHRATR